MKTITTLLGALLILFMPVARAILPESGWYWNPNQSGRGFNIEIQNNLLFIAAFGYKSSGDNIWYVSGGQMSSDRLYSGQLALGSNGQCFGCAYRPNDATAVGNITVNFSDESNATITMLGETIFVRRQDFANLSVSPDGLYGEWATTEGDPLFPVYFGDRLAFGDPLINPSDGRVYAAGNRTGNTDRIALGRYDASISSWLVLLDSSSSYYTAYNFRFAGLNRIEGVSWTYLKSSSLSGSGTYFVGHRTKSRARIKGSNAPGITKAAPMQLREMNAQDLGAIFESVDVVRAERSTSGTPQINMGLLRELEIEMRRRIATSPN